MKGWRVFLRRLLIAAVVLLIFGGAAMYFTLRSQWFREQVRQKIVSVIETTSGGRAEIGAFDFDASNLRARLTALTLHGSEPPASPPLFHAASITVGLKIVSLLKRDVDLESLDIADPRIHLIIDAQGRTNIPEPKIKSRNERNAIDTILNLAVGRFSLHHGVFEVESRGSTEFDARGQNLNTLLRYEPAAPRYRGNISIGQLDAHFPGYVPIPLGISLAVVLEHNRVEMAQGNLTTGNTSFNFSGALEDLNAPHATLRYNASVSLADLSRILRLKGLDAGTAQLDGNAQWAGGS